MARKRITRRSTENPSRPATHSSEVRSDAISGSVTSSVRIILLFLIGLGMVAFLFYPDISRMVGMLYKEDPRIPANKYERNDNMPVKTNSIANDETVASRGEKQSRNDPMESEDDDLEVDVDDPEDETSDLDDVVDDDDSDKHYNDKTKVRDSEKQTKEGSSSGESKETKRTAETSSKTAGKMDEKMVKFSKGEDGKQVIELKMEDFTKEEPKSEPKKTKPMKVAEKNPTKDEGNIDLPKEIRDFKPKYLTSVTAKKIFADGRRIPPIELLAQKPTNSTVRVFLFDEFLSKEECDGLMKAHDHHVQDSTKQDPILCFDSIKTLRLHLKEANKNIKVTPNVFTRGTKCVNATFSGQLADWFKGNWSYSTAFYPGESRFSTIFANRVKAAMGLDQENGGKFQLTSYPKGKAYKSHTDCVVDGIDKRDRVATVLVYLQDVEEGGETRFPELGIWVKPRKGRALVWNNMSPGGKCEADSIHTASKVEKGNKYVLIRWYYYKSFYSLGKRPPEPPLPERAPGQPRVSCDEFEYGSCRWYDEWSYEHLLDYERQKMTLI